MKRLTIAIPSYNRAAVLVKNLKAISNHLPSWVHILIIDNSSDPPVKFDLDLIQKLSDQNVSHEIVRNSANIGGGANILRCFEYAKTDWFLLCGDDDLIDPWQLSELWKLIDLNPEIGFIKFSSVYHKYNKVFIGQGLSEFLTESGGFSHLLFMSTYIFNRVRCQPWLRFGYLMNAAYAPHVAIAMLASQNDPFILSPIIATKANEDRPAWSPVDVVLCSYYLSDIPISAEERNLLTRKIYSAHNVGRELLDIVTIRNTPGLDREAKFLRRKAIRTHMFFGHGMKRVAAIILLLISPLFSGFSQAILEKAYFKMSGRRYKRRFISRHTGL